MTLPWGDPMYGLPMECPEEERPGRLSRALIDASQNLFQVHFEVYFENPSLKVNGEREAWLLCSSMTLPQLAASLRVTKVNVGEPKVVSETFCCWYFYTWWDLQYTYLHIQSLHVQKKHNFNSVGFHSTSVIPTSGILSPSLDGKLLVQLNKPLSLYHSQLSLGYLLLSDPIKLIPSTSLSGAGSWKCWV